METYTLARGQHLHGIPLSLQNSHAPARVRGEKTVQAPESRAEIPDFSVLTNRERQVLLLLADGESNRVLARRLGVAERTVKAHLTNLMRKLNVGSRIQAALIAAQHHHAIRPEGHDPKGQCPKVQ
ncbi:response regulator transcription factor [Streptomyces sp. A3M-1-3]|uniref:response regulator transcription factor n=1 Tax=Streptomyces sp. A3M-1-3 TaxID=2962044 RepID=UPI0020B64DB7|nr:response regulator transcription factor [Streptomyces sp. A3M-1-3]MCP3817911.1 response regulator transcription factor [Streptomyces sp. A3M-1-3]